MQLILSKLTLTSDILSFFCSSHFCSHVVASSCWSVRFLLQQYSSHFLFCSFASCFHSSPCFYFITWRLSSIGFTVSSTLPIHLSFVQTISKLFKYINFTKLFTMKILLLIWLITCAYSIILRAKSNQNWTQWKW